MTDDKLNELNDLKNNIERIESLIRTINKTYVFGKLIFKRGFVLSNASMNDLKEEKIYPDELEFLKEHLQQKLNKLKEEFKNIKIEFGMEEAK